MLAILLAACSAETTEPVTTYEVLTTAETTTPPTIELPSETTAAPETTQAPSEPAEPFKQVYSSVTTQRDAVGNIWLNTFAAVKNTGNEAITFPKATLTVFDGEEEIKVIEDVVCYPNVIEPGECGYFFEQGPMDIAEGSDLRVEVAANLERAVGLTKQTVRDIQVYDLAYGIEIYGAYEPQVESGLVCIAAIVFDLNRDPIAILSDYIDASEIQFVLSSDKLPEGIRSSDVEVQVYAYPYEG